MIHPNIEEILAKHNIPNIYLFTMLVAKRAKQLSEDKKAYLANPKKEKWIRVALNEFATKKIVFELGNEEKGRIVIESGLEEELEE